MNVSTKELNTGDQSLLFFDADLPIALKPLLETFGPQEQVKRDVDEIVSETSFETGLYYTKSSGVHCPVRLFGFEKADSQYVAKIGINFPQKDKDTPILTPFRVYFEIKDDYIVIKNVFLGKTKDRPPQSISLDLTKLREIVAVLTSTKYWDYFLVNSREKKGKTSPEGKSLKRETPLNQKEKKKAKKQWETLYDERGISLEYKLSSKVLESRAFLEFRVTGVRLKTENKGDYSLRIDFEVEKRKNSSGEDYLFLKRFVIAHKQKKKGVNYPTISYIPEPLWSILGDMSRKVLLDYNYNKFLSETLA